MAYWNYAPYVSVAERKAKALKKIKQLKKKNPNIKPVVINGNALAKTWWGKSWNKNLERYADYSNRIDRGRSYVRHGSVLDLQIMPGKIKALVQGSASKPYQIDIQIKPLNKQNWLKIKTICEGKLDSLQELLAGQFPEKLADTFMAQNKGLFPTPDEIEFDCSCPDWADMCKHIAATLYAIGARLDENPALFFELRQVDIQDLISQAVETKTKKLLNKAKKKSSKVLDDADLGDVFGIVMEEEVSFKKTRKSTGTKPQQSNLPGKGEKTLTNKPKKKPISPKRSTLKIKPSNPQKANLTESEATNPKLKNAVNQLKSDQKPIDKVANIIIKSKNGINVSELNEQTGIEKSKLYGLVHQLKNQGKIKNKSVGVYMKNKQTRQKQ